MDNILLVVIPIVVTVTRFVVLYLLIHSVTSFVSKTSGGLFVNGIAQFGCLFALAMGWLTP